MSPFPDPLILALPRTLASAAIVFLFSGAVGQKLLGRWLDSEKLFLSGLERRLIETLFGYAVLLYSIWFMGKAHLYSPAPALVAALAIGLFVRRNLWRELSGWISACKETWNEISFGKKFSDWPFSWKFSLTIIALIALAQLLAAHAPALNRDELSYHLYIPKVYLESGGVVNPPFGQRQSYYHQIFNMAYIPAMALGGELAAKMLNYFWGIILALTTYALARRAGANPKMSAAAAIWLYATPIILHAGEGAMTDLPAAAYGLAGLLCLYLYTLNPNGLFPFLAAALSAIAVNKYTAWTYPVATGSIFAWRNRTRPLAVARGAMVFAACGLMALLPLAYHLWKLKGNPFYPLPIGFGLPYDSIELALQQALAEPRTLLTLWNYLWSKLLSGAWLDGGPYLALAAAAPFLPGLRRGKAGPLLAWMVALILLRFATLGPMQLISRYIIATFAVAAILAVLAWQDRAAYNPRANKLFKGFFIVSLLVSGLMVSLLNAIPHIQLNLGFRSSGEFIGLYYPTERWGAVQFVNSLPKNSRVAVLDHHFMPYHYRDLGGFLWPVPAELLVENEPEKIRQALEKEGISHVYFITSQWDHYARGLGHLWAGRYFGSRLLCRWWEKSEKLPFLEPIYTTQNAAVFELKPP